MRHKTTLGTLLGTLPVVVVAAASFTGCGSSAVTPPSVYITSTLGENAAVGSTNSCAIMAVNMPYMTVGDGPNPNQLIQTGESYMGTPITVNCAVSGPSAGPYSVNLDVKQQGGAEIEISGSVTMSGSTDMTATYSTANGGGYNSVESMPCTLTLSTAFNPPVYAGRIAGSIVCPDLSDPNVSNDNCYGTATFVFQDCTD